MRTVSIPSLRHNVPGFVQLAELHAELRHITGEHIELSFERCAWFDADMAAALSVLVDIWQKQGNSISVGGLRSGVKNILRRNGFLVRFGFTRLPDSYGTTIPYSRFATTDQRAYAAFVEDELISRPQWPEMTTGVRSHLRTNLHEVFENALQHSKTRASIASCGQWFPKRHSLDIAVVDGGVGIHHNVSSFLDKEVSALEAIQWAMEEGNTTKRGGIPGGVGLSLLQEFVKQNDGKLSIISADGHWQLLPSGPEGMLLSAPFPGTAVHLEVNTADTNSYALESELDIDDLL